MLTALSKVSFLVELTNKLLIFVALLRTTEPYIYLVFLLSNLQDVKTYILLGLPYSILHFQFVDKTYKSNILSLVITIYQCDFLQKIL